MTRRILADFATVGMILALLGATYLLPPDTSLRLVRKQGTLRVCVPESYPPLVTTDPERPGIDVEILERVAERLDLRLRLIRREAIGRDFNPRNWRITRAQCAVIAGGVVATGITQSFLETTPPHLETGWASVAPDVDAVDALAGARVGFVPGSSGLDRIALSSYLREAGASTTLLPDVDTAVRAQRAGEVDLLVTEALRARQIAARGGWEARYLDEDLERYPIGFGLWKGDLTLKRAVVGILDDLERLGTRAAIQNRYNLVPLEPR